MHYPSPSRRALTAFAVSLSAAIASVASLGCSSNGSSFDSGMGGSGSSSPTGNMAGSNTDPTNTNGGSGQNPTQTTGGSTQATGGNGSTAGSSNPTGGTGDTGGSGTVGGTGTGGGAGGTDAGPTCPKPAGQICHEFIANDNARNVVNYVNEFTSTKPGGVEWTTNVGSTGVNSPRTIEIVDNAMAAGGKAVMVSVNTGYVEIDLSNGKKLLEVKGNQITGVTGACRLADGGTALGVEGNPAQIRIINANGAETRKFNLPAGSNLRAINLDRTTGHYWLSLTQIVYELNDQGQIQWQANMGANTKGYAVWPRVGGGAYATSGEPHTVLEIDGAGQIVAKIGDAAALAALGLDFFSGFVRTAKGNYVVANWLGHLGSPAATTPQVLEFEPDGGAGKAVWMWGNQTLARQITNVYVIR